MSQKQTSRRNFLTHAAAAVVAAPIIAGASEPEGEEYKVARRCAEIYTAECERGEATEDYTGANYFAEQVDAVTYKGSDQLVPNPDSEFFTLIFTKAVRETGRDDRDYTALKDLIARVDAGDDLGRIAAEREAVRDAHTAEWEREELNAPEPEDRNSAKWRHWKLRQYEHAFAGMDSEAYERAWNDYKALLLGLVATPAFYHVSRATALLPHLIEARQEIDATDAYERELCEEEEGGDE